MKIIGASFIQYFKRNYDFYILLIPGIIFSLIFRYTPMYGLIIAFKDFNIFEGFLNSPWVGLEHFKNIFSDPYFYRVLFNTLLISIYKLIFLFPLPIIFAILLNELKNVILKRTIQTVVYLPHFLSWTIVYGIFFVILGSSGVVNQLLQSIGLESISFFTDQSIFRSVLVGTEGWKTTGWGTIIYLAAITGIDPELYEAAIVDGANKFKQIIHITIPGIAPTIIVLLVLRLGNILRAGFTQILVMYNPAVYDVADIIQTYVYRTGLGQMRFSFSTAVGLFNSIVALMLIVLGNSLAKRLVNRSIW